jgi:hypothetical protein
MDQEKAPATFRRRGNSCRLVQAGEREPDGSAFTLLDDGVSQAFARFDASPGLTPMMTASSALVADRPRRRSAVRTVAMSVSGTETLLETVAGAETVAGFTDRCPRPRPRNTIAATSSINALANGQSRTRFPRAARRVETLATVRKPLPRASTHRSPAAPVSCRRASLGVWRCGCRHNPWCS